MACLFKRGRKYWISFRINGQLTQRSLKTDDPRIAKEKFKQIEYELSIGDMRQVSRTPLVKVLEEFCKYLQTTRPAKSPSMPPIGVRAAETMTIGSVMRALPCLK